MMVAMNILSVTNASATYTRQLAFLAVAGVCVCVCVVVWGGCQQKLAFLEVAGMLANYYSLMGSGRHSPPLLTPHTFSHFPTSPPQACRGTTWAANTIPPPAPPPPS